MNHRVWVLAALLCGLVGCSHAQTRGQAADEPEQNDQELKAVKTIGDVTEVGNVSPVQASGVGLVSGLDGTGGGSTPASDYRKMLEDQLHKQGVQNVKELLASPNHAMVLVSVRIPYGSRRGDPLDVEVTLPPQSKATSLRGGYLLECPLRNYESTRNLSTKEKGPNTLLPGHLLAKANGPLLVGFGEGTEEVRFRRGRIWEGGTSQIELPFFLYLKSDQQSASVANAVATRINAAFPDDADKQYCLRQQKRLVMLEEITSGINDKFHAPNSTGHGDTAQAVGKEIVHVKVPFEYRLNPTRYLQVVRLIPLRESADNLAKYRKHLQDMLLDPRDTIRAALRLEALGKDSLPALRKGLSSDNVLVRFASAEALTYLGSTAGIEELAHLADKHEPLRGHCLAAMASLNESISQMKLTQLMSSPKPQLRYGAFRALLALDESNDMVHGDLLADAFWVHRVASGAPTSMVHIASSRRAEIVLFGEPPTLVPPFRIVCQEFNVIADATDQRCSVSRYVVNSAKSGRKLSSYRLDDVLLTMVEMGAQYPDVVEFLRLADLQKRVSCAVLVDALPVATPVTLLAAAGGDVARYKDQPDLQQEVLAVQQDLGLAR
jgi:hypothetical protein